MVDSSNPPEVFIFPPETQNTQNSNIFESAENYKSLVVGGGFPIVSH